MSVLDAFTASMEDVATPVTSPTKLPLNPIAVSIPVLGTKLSLVLLVRMEVLPVELTTNVG